MSKRKAHVHAPKPKSPPCPLLWKVTRQTMEFIRATVLPIILTLAPREIQLLIRQLASTSTTRYLVRQMEVVLQTAARGRISSLSPKCSVRLIKRKTCSTFAIPSETVTAIQRFKRRREPAPLGTTRRLICGAPQV